jgi:MFS family permease
MGAAGDKIGHNVCWIICLALGSSSFFWLLFARELWALYLFAVVFGFAYGGFSVILSPMVAEQFGLRSHGVIFGVIIMFGGTGGMAIGPLIAGHLFDVTGSYTMPFLMFAVSSVIGLILILFLRPAQLGDGRKI